MFEEGKALSIVKVKLRLCAKKLFLNLLPEWILKYCMVVWVSGRNPVVWPFKWIQQYCHMALFISYVVLTFESAQSLWMNLRCYHSNGNSSVVLSHGTIYIVCSPNCWVSRNPVVWPFKWNLVDSTFSRCYLFFSIFVFGNFWEWNGQESAIKYINRGKWVVLSVQLVFDKTQVF